MAVFLNCPWRENLPKEQQCPAFLRSKTQQVLQRYNDIYLYKSCIHRDGCLNVEELADSHVMEYLRNKVIGAGQDGGKHVFDISNIVGPRYGRDTSEMRDPIVKLRRQDVDGGFKITFPSNNVE